MKSPARMSTTFLSQIEILTLCIIKVPAGVDYKMPRLVLLLVTHGSINFPLPDTVTAYPISRRPHFHSIHEIDALIPGVQ